MLKEIIKKEILDYYKEIMKKNCPVLSEEQLAEELAERISKKISKEQITTESIMTDKYFWKDFDIDKFIKDAKKVGKILEKKNKLK